MYKNSISDFRKLPVQGVDSRLLNNGVDEKKKKYYCSPFGDEWENTFWEIIQDKDFNKFLKGNISFLLDWNYLFGTRAIDLKIRADKVRKNIFEVFKSNKKQLLLDLLKYGDFYCDDRGGSSNLGPWLHRYTLINDDQTWYIALTDNNLSAIITQYLEKNVPTRSSDCLYDRIVNGNSNIIDYMKDNHFLKDNNGLRIVLLEKTQASEHLSRELMVQWLNKEYSSSSWIYNYKTFVIDFKIDLTSVQISNRYDHADSYYYLDLIYDWKNSKSEWNVVIGLRKSAILVTPNFIKTPLNWSCVDGKCKYNGTFPDDWSKSIKQRIDEIVKVVNDLFKIDIIS